MDSINPPKRIAVIGCGVAGLTAGWLLKRKHNVEFFEKNNYPGGHTRTLKVPDGPDAGTSVDTGFIVMNHRNYPLFSEVLRQLEVPLENSSMTFSYHDCQTGYAYSGKNLATLFPSLGHFLKGGHYQLIYDLGRFARIGYRDLQSGYLSGKTLGQYCHERAFSKAFLDTYLYPMGAAIWSSPINQMHAFPAEPYLHFLENHGLLRLVNRPQWKFVRGGSNVYVKAMLKSCGNSLHLQTAPDAVKRTESGVQIYMPDGRTLDFDHVVIATHADQALRLLKDPSKEELAALGPWRYQSNQVSLHRDATHLPANQKLWASWNFAREPGHSDSSPVSVSYYMNELQQLKTKYPYIVTLNNSREIDAKCLLNSTELTHPLYSFDSIAAQAKLQKINGQHHTWYCGSYFGYGFHEDAVRSAVDVAKLLGVNLDQNNRATTDRSRQT